MALKVLLFFAGLLVTIMHTHLAIASSADRGESCSSTVTGFIAVNLANNCCNNNASSGGQQGCCADPINLNLCQSEVSNILNGIGLTVNVLDIAADILKALCGISNDSGNTGGVCNGKLSKASSCLLSNDALSNALSSCKTSVIGSLLTLSSSKQNDFINCVIKSYKSGQVTCCSVNESNGGKCVTCTNNICSDQLNICKKSGPFLMTQSRAQKGCCNAACNSS